MNYVILCSQSPKDLFQLILTVKQAHKTRHNNSIPHFDFKHDFLKNFFFPSTIIEWN